MMMAVHYNSRSSNEKFSLSRTAPYDIYRVFAESKEKRGENSDFWFLGRTVRVKKFIERAMFCHLAVLI